MLSTNSSTTSKNDNGDDDEINKYGDETVVSSPSLF